MRKQFKKALSMVLSAAMVLTLGSGVELKSAKAADEAKTYTATLVAANTNASGGWQYSSEGEAGGKTTIQYDGEYTIALTTDKEITSDLLYMNIPDLWADAGSTVKLSGWKLRFDGEEIALKEPTVSENGDMKGALRVNLSNPWNASDTYFDNTQKWTKTAELTFTISGLAENPEASTEPSATVEATAEAPTSSAAATPSSSATETPTEAPSEEPSATPLPPEPAEFDALLNYADHDWAVQYWGEDASETTVVATNAKVKGSGYLGRQYTVGLDFTKTDAGAGNGIEFLDLEIKGAEPYHSDCVVRIDDIKINGTAVPANVIAQAYTCSDNGEDTRVNLYNGWCPEDDAYNGDREETRAEGDIKNATPWMLIDYIDETVKTIDVTFTYQPAPETFDAMLSYADHDWAVQYWGEAASETTVVATNATVKGAGKYTVGLDFTKTDAGAGNGIEFLDLEIKGAEQYCVERVVRIDDIKINGTAVPAAVLAQAYTCSDNGVDTRVNLYNGWCPEDDAYSGERAEARAYGDIKNATPWMLIDYIDETVKTIEVSFTYGTQAEIEEVDKPAPTETPTETPDADSTTTINGVTYKVTGSTAECSKAKKNLKKVTIPATVTISGKSYKVTSIAAKAFNGSKKLKSVTIGKNVKKIGNQAFFKCTKLKKITFKGTAVKTIGKKAFAKGAKKPTVTVPKKIKKKALKNLKKKLKKAGLDKKAKYKKK